MSGLHIAILAPAGIVLNPAADRARLALELEQMR